MPFILSDWCHETHGKRVSNTWRTHSECANEHRSAFSRVRILFSHFAFFPFNFGANAHSTVALSIQFLGHINCFSYSAPCTSHSMCWAYSVELGSDDPTIFTTVWIILNYLTRNMFVSFGLFGHLRSLFHFGRNRLWVIEMNLWPFRSDRLKMRMPPQSPCREKWRVWFGLAN